MSWISMLKGTKNPNDKQEIELALLRRKINSNIKKAPLKLYPSIIFPPTVLFFFFFFFSISILFVFKFKHVRDRGKSWEQLGLSMSLCL